MEKIKNILLALLVIIMSIFTIEIGIELQPKKYHYLVENTYNNGGSTSHLFMIVIYTIYQKMVKKLVKYILVVIYYIEKKLNKKEQMLPFFDILLM